MPRKKASHAPPGFDLEAFLLTLSGNGVYTDEKWSNGIAKNLDRMHHRVVVVQWLTHPHQNHVAQPCPNRFVI